MLALAFAMIYRTLIGGLAVLLGSLFLLTQVAHAKELPQAYLPKGKCETVLVEFYWDQCSACKKVAPHVTTFEKSMSSQKMHVEKLEIYKSNNTALARDFGVRAVPTFFLFGGNGKELKAYPAGEFKPDDISTAVTAYRKANSCK
jgi:thiol:disulfide interchange protein